MRRLAVAALAFAALSACTQAPEPPAGPAVTLRVLVGSELADMQPILAEAAKETGVTVKMTFTGTLEGADTVAKGEADGAYDAVWFSSTRYLQTIQEAKKRLANTTRIMGSPVVLGVSKEAATRLGRNPSWSDIATAAASDDLRFAMTDPATSNSGFSALVAVAAALDGTGRALDAAAIDKIAPQLTGFFEGQQLTAGSSEWLTEAFVKTATGKDQTTHLDGLINYESSLMSLNNSGKLQSPLTLIYPSDGVVSADYPLSLLAGAQDQVRDGYDRLTKYLKTEKVQQEIVRQTNRRASIPGVDLPRSAPRDLVELPFPDTRPAIEALLTAYYDRLKRPSRTVYVLDVSGSMEGERLASLKKALSDLTGVNETPSAKYCRFRSREEVVLLPFSDRPGDPQTFTVSETNPQPSRDEIRASTDSLVAVGHTAVYDSLITAYNSFAPTDDRFHSIVLMTDGESNAGQTIADFRDYLPTAQTKVRVFPILFGEAAEQEMQEVATLTNGQTWDARTADLGKVFCQIRGYQ